MALLFIVLTYRLISEHPSMQATCAVPRFRLLRTTADSGVTWEAATALVGTGVL